MSAADHANRSQFADDARQREHQEWLSRRMQISGSSLSGVPVDSIVAQVNEPSTERVID